jgi:DNA repair protein RecO (recombination protein O)
MNSTAQGIVIHTIRYSDKKLIVKILCNKHGLRSGIVYVSKTGKSSNRHLFQPLAIIDFNSDFQEVNRFISIKSPTLSIPHHNLATDPVKTAMVLFMNEVLSKTIADDYVNDKLFTYIKNSISLLDDAIDARNFHLWWLMEITRQYGFYPQQNSNVQNDMLFDMMAGTFVSRRPSHPHYLEEELSKHLDSLLNLEWPQAQVIVLHSSIRSALLNALVTYLKLHLDNLREIKSLDVLHAVFHE